MLNIILFITIFLIVKKIIAKFLAIIILKKIQR